MRIAQRALPACRRPRRVGRGAPAAPVHRVSHLRVRVGGSQSVSQSVSQSRTSVSRVRASVSQDTSRSVKTVKSVSQDTSARQSVNRQSRHVASQRPVAAIALAASTTRSRAPNGRWPAAVSPPEAPSPSPPRASTIAQPISEVRVRMTDLDLPSAGIWRPQKSAFGYSTVCCCSTRRTLCVSLQEAHTH